MYNLKLCIYLLVGQSRDILEAGKVLKKGEAEMKKWKCKVCGYIHEGETPPPKCPKCGAPEQAFVEIKE